MKLKPCPFCGGKCGWCVEHDDHGCHWIVCSECKAQFDMTKKYDTGHKTLTELRRISVESFNLRDQT